MLLTCRGNKMSKRALDSLPQFMEEPAFKETWNVLKTEFDLASELIRARMEAGMTQEEVAAKMGISQPAVAKMESGRNVSFKSLRRYATAVGKSLRFTIEPDTHA